MGTYLILNEYKNEQRKKHITKFFSRYKNALSKKPKIILIGKNGKETHLKNTKEFILTTPFAQNLSEALKKQALVK